MRIEIAKVRIDGGTQARAEINEATVADYAEALREGATLPRVTLFYDGVTYWLADGFHRYHAHRRIEALEIDADVIDGDRRAAVLHSVGANDTHGLRRSNADKRKAVETLLADAEWSKWSDRRIADLCHVSVPFVGAMRRPEVAARQKENRTANAVKVAAAGCNPITPPTAQAGDGVSLPQAVKQISPPKPEPIPEDDGAPDEAEIQAALAAEEADRQAFQKLLDSDDKLRAAVEEISRLNALVAKLEYRIVGLQNEANEARRLAKRWKREAERKVAA